MTNQTGQEYREMAYSSADREGVLDLVRARAAEKRLDYPGLDDLRELLDLFGAGECVRLWKDPAGSLAGYAILSCGETYASLVFESAPQAPLAWLGGRMLAWGEEVYLRAYRGQANGISLSVRARESERLALLESHAYLRQADEVLHLARALDEPIPQPVLPPGYTIRALDGEVEAPDWVALHQAAFGTLNMTLEHKLAMMGLPDYDPALDLVALAPDGALAAYVVCSLNREEKRQGGRVVGYTDPVGTHPDHQRKGLCRALLLRGLALLEQRGAAEARLGTGSWNEAMRRAAESAGFRVADRSLLYEKVLRQR